MVVVDHRGGGGGGVGWYVAQLAQGTSSAMWTNIVLSVQSVFFGVTSLLRVVLLLSSVDFLQIRDSPGVSALLGPAPLQYVPSELVAKRPRPPLYSFPKKKKTGKEG